MNLAVAFPGFHQGSQTLSLLFPFSNSLFMTFYPLYPPLLPSFHCGFGERVTESTKYGFWIINPKFKKNITHNLLHSSAFWWCTCGSNVCTFVLWTKTTLVSSPSDYSVLFGCLQKHVARLQCAKQWQQALARVVTQHCSHSSSPTSTELLKQLHWMPSEWFTFKALHTSHPPDHLPPGFLSQSGWGWIVNTNAPSVCKPCLWLIDETVVLDTTGCVRRMEQSTIWTLTHWQIDC